MKKKLLIFFLIIISLFLYPSDDLKDPDNPNDPEDTIIFNDENSDSGKSSSSGSSEKKNKEYKKNNKFNIRYKNKNGDNKQGIIENLSGIYLRLNWKGNENGNQEILLDLVKAIRVKGYKMKKLKMNEKISRVYYIPFVFDIQLNDGTIIKNAKGRIQEFESFKVYNNLGKEKCYTYFMRYWLEDRQIYNDNNSGDYKEIPVIPKAVVVYIEFFEEAKNDDLIFE